jgi:hypothetical protein
MMTVVGFGELDEWLDFAMLAAKRKAECSSG